MKLFNKTIDRQLFKQYSLGSDLSKQEVVVKIFNPYGRGTWFILNSDPNDPDYLWAIVDLGYGAEVGSVSRNELESYRNRMGWGFERDLSFDPVNAQELYNGLREGKFYANGGLITEEKLKEGEWFSPDMKVMYEYRNGRLGITLFYGKDRRYSIKTVINNASELSIKELNLEVKKEVAELKQFAKEMLENNFADGGDLENFSDNQRMIMNQNVQLEHHHEELEDVLEDKMPIPAWVVAKMATATESVSDVTHYLDGQKELMEEENEEEENEEEGEDEEEVKNKEVVEPINVSAGTKAELTKKFTDDAWGNLKGFLKGMEGIELRDDYTFDYKNEQFEVEPIINSDENGVSNAVFSIFDGDGEEVGEVSYSRDGGKQKFTANSEFFSWNNAKFEDGGFMNNVYADGGYFDGTIPKVSTYMSNYAKGGEIAKAEILGLSKNIMGTTDIEMKISGMRKSQDFIVYPISKDDTDKIITIQSSTRIGKIDLSTGRGLMSKSHSNGAYFVHFQMDTLTPFTVSESDLEDIKAHVFKTAGSSVGTRGIVSDNSGASRIFSKGGGIDVDKVNKADEIYREHNIERKRKGIENFSKESVALWNEKYDDRLQKLKLTLEEKNALNPKKWHAHGGETEEGVDLFEDYENIPDDLQEILDNYQDAFEDGDYKGLEKALKEANAIGYTFEYYLDGQAYDLRKIGEKGKSEVEEYAKGGSLEDKLTKLENKKSDLESKLFDAQLKANEKWNNVGWGSGMRKSKLNLSTTREDSLKERIKVVEKEIEQTKEDMLPKKPKYILKADIKTVTVKRNGKEVTYKGADVLNGANVLAKGGDITSKANYIPKRDVVDVELKDGSKVKPVNGYWVKKGAEPIGNEPTPTASGNSEPKLGETYIRKDMRNNWKAETTVDDFNNYDWRISTIKTYSGKLVSSAQGGKTEATGSKGIQMWKYTMYQDPNYTLEVSTPKRLTEKLVAEQHDKALAKFKKFMETGVFKGGGKISNFDKLSAKVAKEYEGKPVKSKYQEEYGKYYSKEEAQEVGDKVAGKVKAMQPAKNMSGGNTSVKKSNSGTETLKKANELAKQIRKEGESWLDAKKRAFAQLKK